jgi:anthranilate synthase component 2
MNRSSPAGGGGRTKQFLIIYEISIGSVIPLVLIIDNYDSFSYNLYQYIGAVNSDVRVIRNDKITVDEIKQLSPTHLVLSPGPGFPKDAGICCYALRELKGIMPILGVCLGHQAIGETFGGRVIHAPRLMHGKKSRIKVDITCPIFNSLPESFEAARYHSLVVERQSLPDCLKITATDEDGEIMGMEHKEYPIYGVQFHPESILTQHGAEIIANFLSL